MYKVLIVDDENIVRRGIKNSINWNEYEVEMVAEAQNGLEALDEVLSSPPDIILLDICMPGMSGLEFASIIKKQYPLIKIVIITGYHDFEYARTALRTGIDDYILKPITKEDVQNIVQTQLNKIKEERTKKPPAPIISNRTLKQNIINTWLKQGSVLTADVASFCSLQNCSEDEEVRFVLIQKYLTAMEVWDNKDNLAEFAIINIADEILTNEKCGFAFTTHKNEMAMLIFANRETTEEILYEISRNVLDFIDLTVYFSVSATGKLCKTEDLCKQASDVADRLFSIPQTGVAFFEDVCKQATDDFTYPIEREQAILKKMLSADREELEANIDGFFESINKGTRQKIKSAILRLLIGISTTVESVNSANLGDYKSFEADEIAEGFLTAQDAKNWIKEYLGDLSRSASSMRTRTGQLFVKIENYLKESYTNSDLNLKKCSEDLFLSSNYISMIIKKETNKTFVDYLNELRITQAEILLKNPESKIYEVSEKVGFTHPTYFSLVFKKITGVTPKQYSSGLGQGVI